MSVDDTGSKLRITIPVAFGLRAVFIAIGAFVIGISVWELHRGVWPLNATSPFFAFMIGGAMSVGVPAILAGLFGWASRWTVEPGRIRIARRNLFAIRRHSFSPAEVARLDVVERQAMEGDNTWLVALVTAAGDRFETHDFPTRQAAQMLRDRISMVFRRQ